MNATKWLCKDCTRSECCFSKTDRQIESCYLYKPLTNADRIRALSDEELAAFIEGESWMCGTYDSCDECPMRKTHGICFSVVEWLKQPVKDGEVK